MVRAGEASGALELTLRRLAEFQEKAQRVRTRIKSALFYPCAVMFVAAAIAAALPAGAQEAQGVHALEEIVVTARQRSESLIEVPVAVSSINAETLQDYGTTDIRDLSRMAPSLNIDRASSGAGGVLALRGIGWRTSVGLIGNTLFWMVLALSMLTLWMLLGTWRHMRRRTQMQNALVAETNFRRAMENSMPTGMRAVDPDGRITYVNAAFCQMIGFTTSELVGQLPPYPYWAPERIDENGRLLQQELQGRSPAGGIEVRVMRKDGSLFDSRMYVSPLIDRDIVYMGQSEENPDDSSMGAVAALNAA
jgi:PAS domain S-box-containing protein